MKQHILKKIPLFVTVSVLLACIVFSGCAGRTVITDAQFKSACEAADCEVTDVSDQFDSMQAIVSLYSALGGGREN